MTAWYNDVDRKDYPADMVLLPPAQDHLEDKFLWRARILERVHVEDIDGPAESLSELRQHKDSHWIWTGARETDGRAVLRLRGKKKQVRRVMWTLVRKGSPDTRRIIVPTCEREGCVNPYCCELMKKSDATAYLRARRALRLAA